MRAVSFCIVVGTPVVPSTRRQFSHCRRHTRRGRVRAVSFCIVVGMAFVAECAPSVFTLSQAHPSWPSARRQFFYSRRHARRGRVRAASFCIVVGTPVVAEYAPSVFALSWARPSWPSARRQFIFFYRVFREISKIIQAGGPEQFFFPRSHSSAFLHFNFSIGSLERFLEFF